MSLTLENLTFDRKTISYQPAAIAIRQKSTGEVSLFDWVREQGTVTTTPVAYPIALSPRDLQKLQVVVTLTSTAALTAPVFVRARAIGKRLLGEVASTPIGPADLGTPRPFGLTRVALGKYEVGKHKVKWSWEASADGRTKWLPFDFSEHPVFATLNHPVAPWGPPETKHVIVPWKEAMALACKWARSARTPEKILEKIAAEVDGLAGTPIGNQGQVVHYHESGAPLCMDQKFFIDGVFRIVKRHERAPTQLNCLDINNTVAIFATLLGVPLRMMRLTADGGPSARFETKPIQLFGQSDPVIKRFSRHEVAVMPGLPSPFGSRQVWDACLRIDFDRAPDVNPPATFGLSTGLRLDARAPGVGYLGRFIATDCEKYKLGEVHTDGLRYPERLPHLGDAASGPEPDLLALRQYFASLVAKGPESERTSPDADEKFDTWLALRADTASFRRRVSIGEKDPVTRVFTPLEPAAWQNRGMSGHVLRAKNRAEAVEAFASLAADYTGALEEVEKERELGDFAMQDRGRTILMLRGPVVSLLCSTDDAPSPQAAFSAGKTLDTALTDFFELPKLPRV